MLYTFSSTDPKHISQCVQPWSQGLFPSHAMEKALGTRLIVCCLEVLQQRKKNAKTLTVLKLCVITFFITFFL